MRQPLIEFVEGTVRRTDLAFPKVGAQVRVNYRIREGEKERIQAFEGVVIRHHDGAGSVHATFTVRKSSQGFGVERIFPFHTPLIESIQVLRQGRVRRAKLYYLRQREGKKARLREVSRA
ncbi:MAG TPA: 50S ribosomal protein L19 [bacterium]|nr:50S ribosomal protein L19 [bacterium]